jgi:hypothetical protein
MAVAYRTPWNSFGGTHGLGKQDVGVTVMGAYVVAVTYRTPWKSFGGTHGFGKQEVGVTVRGVCPGGAL